MGLFPFDQINGMTTENLSLLETKHLVEKSRGKLTMTVLRDDRKFLVSIPEVEDSAPNSEDDHRKHSSSELEGEGWRWRGREKAIKNRVASHLLKEILHFTNCFFCIPSDISDIDMPSYRASRQPTREKRTRRYTQRLHQPYLLYL